MKKLITKAPAQIFVDHEEYEEHINDSLKSIGFSDASDELFYDVKRKLFIELFDLIENEGPSFDVEIFFTSMMDDMNDTFNDLLGTFRNRHDKD